MRYNWQELNILYKNQDQANQMDMNHSAKRRILTTNAHEIRQTSRTEKGDRPLWPVTRKQLAGSSRSKVAASLSAMRVVARAACSIVPLSRGHRNGNENLRKTSATCCPAKWTRAQDAFMHVLRKTTSRERIQCAESRKEKKRTKSGEIMGCSLPTGRWAWKPSSHIWSLLFTRLSTSSSPLRKGFTGRGPWAAAHQAAVLMSTLVRKIHRPWLHVRTNNLLMAHIWYTYRSKKSPKNPPRRPEGS
jgi:hypothetical protein